MHLHEREREGVGWGDSLVLFNASLEYEAKSFFLAFSVENFRWDIFINLLVSCFPPLSECGLLPWPCPPLSGESSLLLLLGFLP